ncbi:hypothetical protein [Streptomyces sp. B1I3]|uniref:hypothetical protein n=1 Tax=Streptomyces sp. B1I3 TaxID=3042264 RepID=UPI002785BB98|nr:hypothetical protein [Streptomyces sp. B1I3]MDQ0792031.1 hypothetical protein [Streptomyces sp. B1I3]
MTTPARTLRQAAARTPDRALATLLATLADAADHHPAGDAGLVATITHPAIAVARGILDEHEAQQPAPAVTTAGKAAALGMEPTDYRRYSHDAAMEQVREAARGLYAETGQRVVDALEQPAPSVTEEPEVEALTAAERQFLTFALDLAFDEMVSTDGFTDEDHAALEKFKRMAAEEPTR